MESLKVLKILKEHKYSLDCLIRTDVVSHLLKQTNEAIKELEALENRSCENCKNLEEINDKCNKGVMLNWKNEIDDVNFCCNRWESK